MISILETMVKKNPPRQHLWECSALWHGQPKIGKSTLAAQYPNVIFADTEQGLGSLDVPAVELRDEIKRVPTSKTSYSEEFVGIPSWERFCTLVDELGKRDHEYQTLVIDTVDQLWLSCVKWHTVHYGVSYENEGNLGYGKGLALITREFSDWLRRAHSLPMGLILISHSTEKEFTKPNGKKDTRIVCTLPSKAMQIVNGMVDLIFYFTFDGGKRVIRTKAAEGFDAGSRIGTLPDMIDMSYEAIATAFTAAVNGGDPTKAKQELISRIHKGEQVLADAKVDEFHIEKRKINSRKKHAGSENLSECDIRGLESYLQHLQTKYQEAQNGNGS